MKPANRFVTALALIVIAAIVVPAAVSGLAILAVTGTVCFLVVRSVMYFTRY